MAHDVFISHASEDKAIADAVCATLEQRRVRCWIAPRDIPAGADWPTQIVGAIKTSRAMVLVFSSRANLSPHIAREVERAVGYGIPIVPFRIEDVLPEGSLEYNLATVHWLDALPPPADRHIHRLADTVVGLLGATTARAAPARQPVRATHGIRRWWIGIAVAAVVAAAGISVWLPRLNPPSQPRESPAPASVTPATAVPPAVPPTIDPPAPKVEAPVTRPEPKRKSPPPVSAAKKAATVPPVKPPEPRVTSTPPAVVSPTTLDPGLKQNLVSRQNLLSCGGLFCEFTVNAADYFPLIKRLQFGESAAQLDRAIEIPSVSEAGGRDRLRYIPIRPGSGRMYARLQLADGTLTEIRETTVRARDAATQSLPAFGIHGRETTVGLRLSADGKRGAPALYLGYSAGSDRIELAPDAPPDTEMVLYAVGDGAMTQVPPTTKIFPIARGFRIRIPLTDKESSLRLRFVPASGPDADFTYTLSAAPTLVVAALKEELNGFLDQAITCTRIPFSLPLPPPGTSIKAHLVADKVKELSFVTKPPAVGCVPVSDPRGARSPGFEGWASVSHVTISADGTKPQVIQVDISWQDAVAHKLPAKADQIWNAVLPAEIDRAMIKVAFKDGTTRDVRVFISQIDPPGKNE